MCEKCQRQEILAARDSRGSLQTGPNLKYSVPTNLESSRTEKPRRRDGKQKQDLGCLLVVSRDVNCHSLYHSEVRSLSLRPGSDVSQEMARSSK